MSDFSALKPYLDISKFNPAQLVELQRGLDLDLDFFTYANPAYSAEEMLVYRTFLETAKYMGPVPKEFYVITDYGPEKLTQGFTSFANYKKYPDRICYVPENWDFEEDGPGYTAKDILTLCNDDQDLADMVFGLCDWQHPSTILDEWDMDDSMALIRKKEDHINALEEEIREITNEFEESLTQETNNNPKPIPDGLLFHIEEQLKVIQIRNEALDKHLCQGGTGYQYSAQLLNEAQVHLIDFCKGASLALGEETVLEYLSADNSVSLMDRNYQKLGYITTNGYASSLDPEIESRPSKKGNYKDGKRLDTIIYNAQSSHCESSAASRTAKVERLHRE